MVCGCIPENNRHYHRAGHGSGVAIVSNSEVLWHSTETLPSRFIPGSVNPRIQRIISASLFLHPGFLIVDHIHFQYNGFMFGILLWSILAARNVSVEFGKRKTVLTVFRTKNFSVGSSLPFYSTLSIFTCISHPRILFICSVRIA